MDLTPKTIREIRKKPDLVLAKDCDYLLSFLAKEWDNLRDVDQLIVLELILKEKQCDLRRVLFFLYKLMEDPDPLYRYHAINLIAEYDGLNQRKFLIEVVQNDLDFDNRVRALILLSTIFKDHRDREILRLALSMYDDPKSRVEARLTAGAAMMFQLGIPSGEDGRPAFWDENEEELSHPIIQFAVSETRKLLSEII